MLAVDNVAPRQQSGLKLYFQSPHTSFASVCQVMTLGGRICVAESLLQELRSLIAAVALLADDFPEEAEVPCATQAAEYNPATRRSSFTGIELPLSGYVYYFDIAPDKTTVPDIKLYCPVHRYGPDDDGRLAQGIADWMGARGRCQDAQRYRNMLAILARHRNLRDDKGMQTWVSCLFTKTGEVDVTSFIRPDSEALDLACLAPAGVAYRPTRRTRRRSDSR